MKYWNTCYFFCTPEQSSYQTNTHTHTQRQARTYHRRSKKGKPVAFIYKKKKKEIHQ